MFAPNPEFTAQLIDAGQAAVGLWVGLLGGTAAGILISVRRDEKLRQRLNEELAHNADLRASLVCHRNIIRLHSLEINLPQIPAAPKAAHHWPARALERLGLALGCDQRKY